ncbi:MAG: transcriptional repressor [Deltaproteobacteria bacterium]|nr:transcriptional repressor [Deltaproteobacteria bacterium]
MTGQEKTAGTKKKDHRENAGGSRRAHDGPSRYEAFEKLLFTKGLRLTRQRRAVLNEVFKDEEHFEAEELVERMRKATPRVSRATVYRTLELLQECQLVEKLDFGNARSFYESVSPNAHHDHLICNSCGKVTEFHDPRLEEMQSSICSQYGFRESHHSLRIFGLCRECRQ